MVKLANKPGKKKSKRQPLKMKYKIEKKCKDHRRKLKKEAKKLKALGIFKSKRSKDLGLPNLYPFKAQVLESLQRKKEAKQKEDKLRKLQKKQEKQTINEEIDINQAEQKTQEFEDKFVEEKLKKNQNQFDDEDEEQKFCNNQGQQENRKHYKELKKLIEASDIILEVLDARDPLGCRCKETEAEILAASGDKKIILILNKIDLVPQDNAEAWLKYLRREYATVLFKANTQSQNQNFGSAALFKKNLNKNEDLVDSLLTSSKAIGADNLLQLIKNYSKKDGIKQAVSVGLIGYPNVGKSSIINSLKKSKAAGVSSVPGFTKNLQEISLDKKVKLIDCPGVIFSNDGEKASVLRNIIKVGQIQDPISPLEEILKKVNKNELLLLYKIPDYNDVNEFLMHVSISRGKMVRGGKPNIQEAAKLVLNDWNSGKIKFFTNPPNMSTTETSQMALE